MRTEITDIRVTNAKNSTYQLNSYVDDASAEIKLPAGHPSLHRDDRRNDGIGPMPSFCPSKG